MNTTVVEEKTQTKKIDANVVIKKISALDSKIAIKEDKYKRHFVKYGEKMICFVMDQKYGVAIRKRVGGRYTTVKITNENELTNEISVLKEQLTAA